MQDLWFFSYFYYFAPKVVVQQLPKKREGVNTLCYCCWITLSWIHKHKNKIIYSALADPRGAPGAPLPRVPILSFWHTKFSKRNHIRRRHEVGAPSYGKFWIRHCSPFLAYCCLLNLINSCSTRFTKAKNKFSVILNNSFATILHFILKNSLDLAYEFKL